MSKVNISGAKAFRLRPGASQIFHILREYKRSGEYYGHISSDDVVVEFDIRFL